MATQDVQISDLTQVTTPATTDLLLIRHGTVDSKITYSDIKSAINTNTLYASSDGVVTDQANLYYNRSQVDAKVTNLQNQIDTLNSKITFTLPPSGTTTASSNNPVSVLQEVWGSIPNDGYGRIINVNATGGSFLMLTRRYGSNYGMAFYSIYSGACGCITVNNGTFTNHSIS